MQRIISFSSSGHISGTDNKCIEGVMFAGWGSHTDHTRAAYLTAAAAIGMTQLDLERFIKRLEKVEIMILLLLPSLVDTINLLSRCWRRRVAAKLRRSSPRRSMS